MRIAVAADHAGYGLKCELIPWLRAREHQVNDLGTHGVEPVDYPDLAVALGRAIMDGAASAGGSASAGATMAAAGCQSSRDAPEPCELSGNI